MTPNQFEAVARKAIAKIPAEFQPYLEECTLHIEPRATKAKLRELEMDDDEELFGLYEGTPLIERRHDDPPEGPPRITLYYEPLLDYCLDEKELVYEIQVTVLHEIGHHFGLDENRLAELGYE